MNTLVTMQKPNHCLLQIETGNDEHSIRSEIETLYSIILVGFHVAFTTSTCDNDCLLSTTTKSDIYKCGTISMYFYSLEVFLSCKIISGQVADGQNPRFNFNFKVFLILKKSIQYWAFTSFSPLQPLLIHLHLPLLRYV